MAYISPGDAFSTGLQDYYTRQQEQQLAMQREQRAAAHDQMLMEQARAALAEKRQIFDEAQKDKRKTAFEKTISEMMPGDIPTPELVQQAKEFGLTHVFPQEHVIPEPQMPEAPQSIISPEAAAAPMPQAPTGVRPPQLGGFRFIGTRKEREAKEMENKVNEIRDQLDSAEPGSPEERKAIMNYEMVTGKQVPARRASGGVVGSFEDYVVRSFGQNPTPTQLEQARKKWGEENRRPEAETSHYQLQPELDTAGKPTGKFYGYNGKTNKFELVEGTTPQTTKAAPGAGPMAIEANKKKDAINVLNQLDKAIDEAKEFLGPGAGRVTSIEQMVGMADPKAHKVATKMLMAKMKLDAAIGGVRAAASPELLKRWDNILGLHTNPDSLHAAVQSLREIMSNLDEEGGDGSTTETPTSPNRIVYDINGNLAKPVKR